MFDEQAFRSWPLVVAGAFLFAALFALLALLSERVLEGTFRVTSAVVGFGIVAFIGYLGTALILRRGTPPRR